jgi:hypothetical protein
VKIGNKFWAQGILVYKKICKEVTDEFHQKV